MSDNIKWRRIEYMPYDKNQIVGKIITVYGKRNFEYFNICQKENSWGQEEVSMLHVDAEPYETAELMRFK